MPVPSLSQLARTALIRNIDTLEDVGDLPYSFCRPFLMKIENPEQLRTIEENSPQIKGKDAELWKAIIQREIPNYRKWPHEPRAEDSKKWYEVYRYLRKREAEDDAAASERLAARIKQYEDERKANKATIVSEVIPLSRRKPVLARSYAGSSKLSTSLTAGTRKPFQPAGTSVPRRVPIAQNLIAERKAAKEAQAMKKAIPRVLQSNDSKVPLPRTSTPERGPTKSTPQANDKIIRSLPQIDSSDLESASERPATPKRKIASYRPRIRSPKRSSPTGITPTPSPPPTSGPASMPQWTSPLGSPNHTSTSLPELLARTSTSPPPPPRILKKRKAEVNIFMPQKRR